MGYLRITSGTLRGRKIETPAGSSTRPLLSRLRKSLADILRPRLAEANVLDLFGGSGAIAFELLSNGAACATVVEINSAAARLINANARTLGMEDRCETLVASGIDFLHRYRGNQKPFDIVIVAPPYAAGLQQQVVDVLANVSILTRNGTVIIQRDRHEPACCTAGGGLHLVQSRTYGRTVFDFYELYEL